MQFSILIYKNVCVCVLCASIGISVSKCVLCANLRCNACMAAHDCLYNSMHANLILS